MVQNKTKIKSIISQIRHDKTRRIQSFKTHTNRFKAFLLLRKKITKTLLGSQEKKYFF